jgi:adenylosuccinate synthase
MVYGRMNVVFGGQCGSEAKGKLAAYLVHKFNLGVVAGCLSPNAGHTVVAQGERFVTHHIPIGVVGGLLAGRRMVVVLGRSSVINVGMLLQEWGELDGRFPGLLEMMVDERAAVITEEHIREEGGMTDIGSTTQGVGAARRDHIMRVEGRVLAGDEDGLMPFLHPETSEVLDGYLEDGHTILYEMGQGFDLCLQHGIHERYCTSRVVNPAMAFAESGVSLRHAGHSYAVVRPYPIRVNNRTGWSGPYTGAHEITWETVRERSGYEKDLTEITTTTKLPRRVFEFSWARFHAMMRVCSPDFLCLQFANYLDQGVEGAEREWQLTPAVTSFINRLEEGGKIGVAYVGTGADHREMVDTGVDYGQR